MNFLLLGNGGREHAIAWKLQQSELCDQLFIAPGNAGTSACGENIPIALTDFESIKEICIQKRIDIVIPGPEVPLVEGVTDYFKNTPELENIPVAGPGKSGARLEGSKSFAKEFMQRHGIPTAAYREFDSENFEEGKKYIQGQDLPIVLKADGLAAGKGVLICETYEQALSEYEQMLAGKFGQAGSRVVVESFLDGIELSVFVLTDGKDYLILPEAKDYKRIGAGDTGLNTGGMGALSPVPFADTAFMKKIETQVIQPTIKGIEEDQLDYCGFIFFGLIKVEGEPFVIEYNCRLGDPETEVVLPRVKNDLGHLLKAAVDNKLADHKIETDPHTAATTILVSGGYPEAYEKGKEIQIPNQVPENTYIFHAGTTEKGNQVVTNGGRVLALTALADNLDEALKQSGLLAEEVQFEGKYYRKDIGWEFV